MTKIFNYGIVEIPLTALVLLTNLTIVYNKVI